MAFGVHVFSKCAKRRPSSHRYFILSRMIFPTFLLCGGGAQFAQLIDIIGHGGGFIMDASTQFDDAKPENAKAMFEFTKEYGVYRMS